MTTAMLIIIFLKTKTAMTTTMMIMIVVVMKHFMILFRHEHNRRLIKNDFGSNVPNSIKDCEDNVFVDSHDCMLYFVVLFSPFGF